MKEFSKFIKTQFLKLFPHLILLTSIILSYFTSENTNFDVIVKATMALSFALSVYFTLNITVSFNKYLSGVIIKQNNTIIENQNKISNYEMQFKNLIYKPMFYVSDNQEAYLAIDVVPYTIKNSIIPFKHEEYYIEYVDDSIVENQGVTYYCYVNGDYVHISIEKEAIIQDYYHDTMEQKKIQGGTALCNKPRHLVVFKLINIGMFPAKAFRPFIRLNGNENIYKGIHPRLLQPKDEVLFVVLVELQGEKRIKYECVFEYSNRDKRMFQKLSIVIENKSIEFSAELSEPEELTSSVKE